MSFECAAAAKLNPGDVALVVHHGDIGQHIGFAVFTTKNRHEFLHLAFHKKVIFADFPPDKCAIVGRLPFDHVGLMVLKKALWKIGEKSRQKEKSKLSIPYGVSIDTEKGSFDKSGVYKTPPGADGLTCATFVTEICRNVGLKLVEEGDWQARPEDAPWIDQICSMLRDPRSGADQAHIDHVRASFKGIRIRPEEVAGASTIWKGKAVKCAPAETAGLDILKKLAECCPRAETMPAASGMIADSQAGKETDLAANKSGLPASIGA